MITTLSPGWWLAPAIISAAALAWVVWISYPRQGRVTDTLGSGALVLLGPLAATLVSMSSWLIWHLYQ